MRRYRLTQGVWYKLDLVGSRVLCLVVGLGDVVQIGISSGMGNRCYCSTVGPHYMHPNACTMFGARIFQGNGLFFQ